MANNTILSRINIGQIITADLLNGITKAVNENAKAITGPKQKTSSQADPLTSGAANEVFSSTVTESDITATDSNGDTTTLKRVDVVTCTEDTTGRTMTINITYT